jgi:dihydrolipoamide dehydrogenase
MRSACRRPGPRRQPNEQAIGAKNAGVAVDKRGFIAVDKQMCSTVPHILAIDDIVGQPMLARKAMHEGRVAAEPAAGHNSIFDVILIPITYYS